MFTDMWTRGLVFIIPTPEAENISDLHYHPAHWARKKGKPGGRQIGDLTDGGDGALNSERANEKLKELYGDIEHPTIDELVQMVEGYAKEMQQQMGGEFRW